jgi:hypothetical protein
MRVLTFLCLTATIIVTSFPGLRWLLPQWGFGPLGQFVITGAVSTTLISISFLVTVGDSH